MSDPIEEAILAKEEKALNEINAMFHEDSYYTRIQKMFKGFSAPHESREYKAARIEAQRLAAPACAVLIPLLSVILLAILAVAKSSSPFEVEVEILQPEEVKELEEEKLEEEIPDIETEIDIETDVTGSAVVAIGVSIGTTAEPVTQQPVTVEAVLNIRSPVIMKRIFGSRTAGMRGQLMKRFGGDTNTEAAVMAALRWLKKNQSPDGSWPQNRVAMTGLALLSFLAHGEKPGASSPEFGETVQKAIEFLIRSQEAGGRMSTSYQHPMATYALCEAYGMTMNPDVKDAAEKGIQVLIDGQTPTGGWCYGLVPSDPNDTSVMGWCAQALKAAYLSNVCSDKGPLEEAMKKAIRGFQGNHNPSGGFGYRSPGATGLSAVGALCLQLLGVGGGPEVRSTLILMEGWKAGLTAADGAIGGSTQYYYYYATQAKFHNGGKMWDDWNAQMKPIYLKALIIEKGVYTDHLGKLQDIGHWVNTDQHTDRPVMDTCLAALQLMVYYRNLPSFGTEAVKEDGAVVGGGDAASDAVAHDDIVVDTGNL